MVAASHTVFHGGGKDGIRPVNLKDQPVDPAFSAVQDKDVGILQLFSTSPDLHAVFTVIQRPEIGVIGLREVAADHRARSFAVGAQRHPFHDVVGIRCQPVDVIRRDIPGAAALQKNSIPRLQKIAGQRPVSFKGPPQGGPGGFRRQPVVLIISGIGNIIDGSLCLGLSGAAGKRIPAGIGSRKNFIVRTGCGLFLRAIAL